MRKTELFNASRFAWDHLPGNEKGYKYRLGMLLKFGVILLVSFAVAFCSLSCDPQKAKSSAHCEKPVKDSSKPSIGCCHTVNGVIEKEADSCVGALFVFVAMPPSPDQQHFQQAVSSPYFTASPPPTHAILRV
jgi:hypothetical protein